MSVFELESLKDEVVAMLNDINVCNYFENDPVHDRVFFSKGPCFTILPLELEMSGVTPSKIIDKEPANKKNLFKHYVSDGAVVKIESYDSGGFLDETELVNRIGDRFISLRKNKHDEVLSLKVVDLDCEKVVRGCRVDGDFEYWAYRYEWKGNLIDTIVSFASNSVAGTVIQAEFSSLNQVSKLFFVANGKEVNIYIRK
ncbi:MAG: hypothetical protein I8H93_27950 [Pseudomonadales bacterium]|jgi:hypothetical protein|nr:hypothetical protein [Pseudomonadales bacterium]